MTRRLRVIVRWLSVFCLGSSFAAVDPARPCRYFGPNAVATPPVLAPTPEEIFNAAAAVDEFLDRSGFLADSHARGEADLLAQLKKISEYPEARAEFLSYLDPDKVSEWRRLLGVQGIRDPDNGKVRLNEALKKLEDLPQPEKVSSRTLTPDEQKFVDGHTVFHREARMDKLSHLPGKLKAGLPSIFLKLARAKMPAEVAKAYGATRLRTPIWIYVVNSEGSAYRIAFVHREGVNYIGAILSHEDYNGEPKQRLFQKRFNSMGFQ